MFVIILSGSIFGVISQLKKDPLGAIIAIGTTLPNVSTFLINLTLTTVLCGVPTLLLGVTLAEVVKQYRQKIKILLRSGPAGLKRMNDIKAFPFPALKINYGIVIPNILFTVCVLVCYSIIAPIVGVVVFVALYGQFIAWRYLVCYVASPAKHDSCGAYFIQSLQLLIKGLMASNVLFIIYMGIKGGVIQSILLLPMPVVVYALNRHILGISTDESALMVSREAAVQIDAYNSNELSEKGKNECGTFRQDFFVPAELQPL
jgi:hypothetical protein